MTIYMYIAYTKRVHNYPCEHTHSEAVQKIIKSHKEADERGAAPLWQRNNLGNNTTLT